MSHPLQVWTRKSVSDLGQLSWIKAGNCEAGFTGVWRHGSSPPSLKFSCQTPQHLVVSPSVFVFHYGGLAINQDVFGGHMGLAESYPSQRQDITCDCDDEAQFV